MYCVYLRTVQYHATERKRQPFCFYIHARPLPDCLLNRCRRVMMMSDDEELQTFHVGSDDECECETPTRASSPSSFDGNKASLVKRPWTTEEDESLIAAVHKYGACRWSMIATHLSTGRVGKQCRERCARQPCLISFWFSVVMPRFNRLGPSKMPQSSSPYRRKHHVRREQPSLPACKEIRVVRRRRSRHP